MSSSALIGVRRHPLKTAVKQSSPSSPAVALLLACAVALIVLVAVGIGRRLIVPQPDNPWESGQITEAWRVMHGAPLYEWPERGHATQMYGLLAPYALAAVFKATGVNIWAGRLLELVAACATLAILVRIARPAYPFTLASIALFAVVDTVTNDYFVQNRPDMLAILVAVTAIVVMHRGVERRSALLYVFGSALVVVAFLIKQTMAMAAAIPILPILLDRRFRRTTCLAMIVTPFLLIGCTIVALRAVQPIAFYYLIDVPKLYPLSMQRAMTGLSLLAAAGPLFIVSVVDWLRRDRPRLRFSPWLLSALVVSIPASLLPFAKSGGAENSLLPALLAMALFASAYLPTLVDGKSVMFVVVAGLLLMCGLSAVKSLGYHPAYGDYRTVVHDVADLRGALVVAPEDPTIPMLATGTVGRNIYLEFDAVGWPARVPQYLLSELSSADYVVDVNDWWQNLVTPDMLRTLGFVPTRRYEHYTLWHRSH